MIPSLRRKFILIAMASLIGTMAVLCAAIGLGNYCATTSRVDKAISLLYQNGGTFLSPGAHSDPSNFHFQVTPETAFETRYFIVTLTPQKEIQSADLEHIAALDRQTAADLGLLEDTCGGDRWLESAKAQITRLDRLIKNLVELARTEETIREHTAEVFSVSEIARASAEAFQPLAEGDGKSLTAEIAEDVSIKGVRDNFFRLFSILLDNAVKYCDPGGTVRLSVAPAFIYSPSRKVRYVQPNQIQKGRNDHEHDNQQHKLFQQYSERHAHFRRGEAGTKRGRS